MSDKLKINGQLIEISGYQGWFMFHTLDISEYIREGVNEIEMNYIKSPIDRLELIIFHSKNELGSWYSQDLNQLDRVLVQDKMLIKGPIWHTLHFAKPILPEAVHAKLKLRLTGMSKGYVKLNGIDLGRYWNIGPQEDYKIPMAWLQEVNQLEIFDEEGREASAVKLIYDNQSSRRWVSIG
jgi:hypothetical protein